MTSCQGGGGGRVCMKDVFKKKHGKEAGGKKMP